MKLHFEVVKNADAVPKRSMLFLHGIIGSGTNHHLLHRSRA